LSVRDRLAAALADFLDDLIGDLARRLVAVHRDAVVVHHDLGAGFSARQSDGASDATAGAGDGDGLPLEILSHGSLPLWTWPDDSAEAHRAQHRRRRGSRKA